MSGDIAPKNPHPLAVDTVPHEHVLALVEQNDRMFAALEAELAAALAEADATEARLRSHPAAAVMGDEFESYVVAMMAQYVDELRRAAPAAPPRPAPPTRPQAIPSVASVPDPEPVPHDVGSHANAELASADVPVVQTPPTRPSRRSGGTTVVVRRDVVRNDQTEPAPAVIVEPEAPVPNILLSTRRQRHRLRRRNRKHHRKRKRRNSGPTRPPNDHG